MKLIFIKLISFLLSLVLLAFALIYIEGVYQWVAWSNNDYKPYSFTGMIHDVKRNYKKNSCRCTILTLKNDEDTMYFYSNMTKDQATQFQTIKDELSIQYYPKGNGENNPIEIKLEKNQKILYTSNIYKGYGLVLTLAVVALLLISGGIFLLLYVIGFFKSDKNK